MFALFGGRFISYYRCYEHKTTAGLTHFFFISVNLRAVLLHEINARFSLLLSKFLMNYALRINMSRPLMYHDSDILTYGLAVFVQKHANICNGNGPGNTSM
jgi:uncharacterized membrane protein YGL010W